MQFMDNLEGNEKASIILEAVIRMAKWMKLPVVAEGVETRKEWNYLKSMECEMVQGYYFYKPIPQADFCEVLDQEVLQKYAVKSEIFLNLMILFLTYLTIPIQRKIAFLRYDRWYGCYGNDRRFAGNPAGQPWIL